jgi:hypothetical protein
MKTTIDMAREAGGDDWGLFKDFMPEIERLVALVRADERDRAMRENAYVQAEREACAKVCDDMGPCGFTGESCAAAIRNRGNT